MFSRGKCFLLVCLLALPPSAPARAEPPPGRTDAPAGPPARTDHHGDPLPPGALQRLGTVRWRTSSSFEACPALGKDGRTLFVGTGEVIRVFDLETGRQVRTIKGPEGGISALALAPDGKLLASGGYQGVTLWDVATGQKVRHLKAGDVRTLAFSADGRRLVTGGRDHDHSVRVFDAETGKEQLRLLWHQRQVDSVALSPDGTTLVTASYVEHKVLVTDLSTGEVSHTLLSEDGHDAAAALSPDGKTVAVADMRYQTGRPDWVPRLRLFDVATGREVRAFDAKADRTVALAFAPDGKTLVSSTDENFRLWDVETGQEKGHFPGGGRRICFSPDGRRLLAVGAVIRAWDVEGGKELHPSEGHAGYISSLAYAPDGQTIAACSTTDPQILLWDVAGGKVLRTLPGHDIYVRSVAFTREGKLVSGGYDSTLRVWDPASGRETFQFRLHEPRAGEKPLQVLALGVSRDGQRLAAACAEMAGGFDQDLRFFVWSLASGKLLGSCEKKDRFLVDMPAFSPDGRTAILRDEADLVLKDLLSGKQVAKLRPAGPAPDAKEPGREYLEGPFAFSPDGRTLAVCSLRSRQDGPRFWHDQYAVRLFDAHTGEELRRIPTEDWRQALTFSPDGKRLAATGEHALYLWDVETGRPLWRSPDLDTRASALAFSPDGTRLASGMDDTTILIWDVGPSQGSSREEKP